MVKKNNNFKFKGSAKKAEKSPRKAKSSFIPYDESIFSRNDDNTEDLVRTYLRDTRIFGGSSGRNYYEEDDYNSL
jgi:hypothetical protein